MIKKDHLSEVEAIYVQRAAMADVPRLFVVWTEAGQSVHGFVAVREKASGGVVNFKPVTDIVALHNHEVDLGSGHTHFVDYTKRSPQDLLWMIIEKTAWKDEEAICAEEPTIDEDVVSIGERGAFYVVASPQNAVDAPITGVFKGKIGYTKVTPGKHAGQHVQDRYALGRVAVEIVFCQEMDLQDAIDAERNTLKGLRAAFKCAPGSEWFELPYPKGLDWNTFGAAEIAKALIRYQVLGERLP